MSDKTAIVLPGTVGTFSNPSRLARLNEYRQWLQENDVEYSFYTTVPSDNDIIILSEEDAILFRLRFG